MSEIENKSAKEITVVESAVNDKVKSSESAGDSLGNNASETTSPTLTSPQMDNKKTPVKRTPSKRMSFIERAQKESEELVKNMGGSLELEGGRRTRSSTRGTPTRAAPIASPPPSKKSRNSPATSNSASTRARGRGRKLNTTADSEVVEKDQEPTTNLNAVKEQNNVEGESTKQTEDAVDATVNVVSKIEENSVNDEDQSAISKVEEKLDKAPEEPIVEKTAEDKVEKNQREQSVDNGLEEASSDNLESAPSQGSPMDTDEPIENVPTIGKVESEQAPDSAKEASIPEKSDEPANASEVPAVKESTPEPMEVDGNSKSNDEVDNATVTAPESVAVEKLVSESKEEKTKEDIVESAADSVEPEVGSKPKETVEPETQPLESSAADGVVEEDKANDEKTVTNNNNAESIAVENDNAPTVEGGINSTEKQINNDVEVKSGTNSEVLSSENKTENELCAPKIVSEAITATTDSALTTPQSCN